MNTQENNRLVAEFMELEVENGLYYYTTSMDDYKTDTLYFDSSWDWLMPVVNKIRSFDCKFDIEQIGVFDWDDEISHYEFDLDLTYNAVVEFINQYNKNQ